MGLIHKVTDVWRSFQPSIYSLKKHKMTVQCRTLPGELQRKHPDGNRFLMSAWQPGWM